MSSSSSVYYNSNAGSFFSKNVNIMHVPLYVLTTHFRVTNNDKFDWTKIRLWYTGSNVAYITSELVTSCRLDLTYYPFDKQTCDVKVRNEVTSSKGKTSLIKCHTCGK